MMCRHARAGVTSVIVNRDDRGVDANYRYPQSPGSYGPGLFLGRCAPLCSQEASAS